MFQLHTKPSWKSRLRLAWKALRGVPLHEESLQQQLIAFSQNTAATGAATVTWKR